MAIVVWFLVVITSWLSGGMGTVEVGQVESYPQLQSTIGVVSDQDHGGTICFDNDPKPRKPVEETTWGAFKSIFR